MPRALALLAVLTIALALPAAALAKQVHFTTPSGNIDCRGAGSSISCEVQKAHWPRVPPRPKDCDLDWVGTQLNLSQGRVTLGSCRGDIGPLCVPSSPGDRCTTLAYGRSVVLTRNGIRCTSRRTGLTCRARNGGGAGFTAAREGYRIYR
ncbi:MAG TPA: DUF6636 domain-containing protein [Miltoncostaeaceae bacterium]|nr:DUF6636 domain-containing protein [Miltoncostaeaceae bacterium]